MLLIGRRLILEGSYRYGNINMEVIKEREKEVAKGYRLEKRISVFGFEGTALSSFILASWLSWLERRPVTAEVVGSSPIGVARVW